MGYYLGSGMQGISGAQMAAMDPNWGAKNGITSGGQQTVQTQPVTPKPPTGQMPTNPSTGYGGISKPDAFFGAGLPTGGMAGAPGGFNYGRPRSIFEGMPDNPTMGQLMGQMISRQEENRNSALGVLGYNRGEQAGHWQPWLQGAGNLMQNPYSMGPETVQAMKGQGHDFIAKNASRLEGLAKDRAAAQGVSRSGSTNASVDAIRTNAMNQIAGQNRDIDIKAAIQNKQDQRDALQTTLPGYGAVQDARNTTDLSAVRDVLGASQFYGDAFLMQYLLSGMGQNPYTGAAGSAATPNVAGFNGFGYQLGPSGTTYKSGTTNSF